MIDRYFDTQSAAKELGNVVSPRTLEKWRLLGIGPIFRKFGRKVVYAESDLHAWAQNQKRTSTSQT